MVAGLIKCHERQAFERCGIFIPAVAREGTRETPRRWADLQIRLGSVLSTGHSGCKKSLAKTDITELDIIILTINLLSLFNEQIQRYN